MNFWKKVMKLNRRWIFLLIALAVFIPFLKPLRLPLSITKPAKDVFDAVESIPPEGPPLLIATDYAPSTAPELDPMLYALLRHCFVTKRRVMLLALYPQGAGMAQAGLDFILPEFPDVKSGEDYVFLGYQPGVQAVVMSLGEDVRLAFPTDAYGVSLDSLPMMEHVRNYDDIALVVDLAGSSIPITWVIYAVARYGQRLGVGVTAVSAAQYYPYLNSGQFIGMLGGLKGAAEYEILIQQKGYTEARQIATIGMDSQSIAHLVILALIIIGNIAFFASKSHKKKGTSSK
ncbi:MAG: hypothetical protein E3J41_09050 [Candidatus Cloacimonadota bacterium]|nr:MAG: hypothetical protein E3J41_09050 [Candidatus Cloacimonadota bacterium]